MQGREFQVGVDRVLGGGVVVVPHSAAVRLLAIAISSMVLMLPWSKVRDFFDHSIILLRHRHLFSASNPSAVSAFGCTLTHVGCIGHVAEWREGSLRSPPTRDHTLF